MKQLSPAIFLDRDGTLHRDKEYLIKYEDVEFIPDVVEALLLLRNAGYRLFVASNQSGVARGYFTLDEVVALNQKMREYFLSKGIDIEDWAVCPHLPEGTVPAYARDCDCRKPKPGLLLDLAKRHSLDLSRSYMVGDKLRDAQAGIAAGATGVLISPNSTGSIDAEMRLQEFPSMLDFAKSVTGVDASHAS